VFHNNKVWEYFAITAHLSLSSPIPGIWRFGEPACMRTVLVWF
jgi:hypothetical protein